MRHEPELESKCSLCVCVRVGVCFCKTTKQWYPQQKTRTTKQLCFPWVPWACGSCLRSVGRGCHFHLSCLFQRTLLISDLAGLMDRDGYREWPLQAKLRHFSGGSSSQPVKCPSLSLYSFLSISLSLSLSLSRSLGTLAIKECATFILRAPWTSMLRACELCLRVGAGVAGLPQNIAPSAQVALGWSPTARL